MSVSIFLVSRRHFFLHACPVLRRVGAQCGCSAFADLTQVCVGCCIEALLPVMGAGDDVRGRVAESGCFFCFLIFMACICSFFTVS